MEVAKQEIEIVGQMVIAAHEADVEQLNELQLTLIGSGLGEVVFA